MSWQPAIPWPFRLCAKVEAAAGIHAGDGLCMNPTPNHLRRSQPIEYCRLAAVYGDVRARKSSIREVDPVGVQPDRQAVRLHLQLPAGTPGQRQRRAAAGDAVRQMVRAARAGADHAQHAVGEVKSLPGTRTARDAREVAGIRRA